MQSVLNSLDPMAVLGFGLAFILLSCAMLMYTMRDRTPMTPVVARRLRCPHSHRRVTVEFVTGPRATVHYCSAHHFGELNCDLACAALMAVTPASSSSPRPS